MDALAARLMRGLLGATCVLAAACTPAASTRDAPGNALRTEACAGTTEPRCVVYASGAVGGDDPVDRGLRYQLQGSGMSDAGETAYCRGGYCAVAILGRDDDGGSRLLAYAQSAGAGWYQPPELVPARGGPVIVAESNSLGSGHFNDDIVFRFEGDALRRIDVQSWKSEATALTPGANTHFDWTTDYSQLVGSTTLMSGAPDEGIRTPQGGCARVFLFLDGDALTVAAPPVRLPKERC